LPGPNSSITPSSRYVFGSSGPDGRSNRIGCPAASLNVPRTYWRYSQQVQRQFFGFDEKSASISNDSLFAVASLFRFSGASKRLTQHLTFLSFRRRKMSRKPPRRRPIGKLSPACGGLVKPPPVVGKVSDSGNVPSWPWIRTRSSVGGSAAGANVHSPRAWTPRRACVGSGPGSGLAIASKLPPGPKSSTITSSRLTTAGGVVPGPVREAPTLIASETRHTPSRSTVGITTRPEIAFGRSVGIEALRNLSLSRPEVEYHPRMSERLLFDSPRGPNRG
jgi:hypothetical protein